MMAENRQNLETRINRLRTPEDTNPERLLMTAPDILDYWSNLSDQTLNNPFISDDAHLDRTNNQFISAVEEHNIQLQPRETRSTSDIPWIEIVNIQNEDLNTAYWMSDLFSSFNRPDLLNTALDHAAFLEMYGLFTLLDIIRIPVNPLLDTTIPRANNEDQVTRIALRDQDLMDTAELAAVMEQHFELEDMVLIPLDEDEETNSNKEIFFKVILGILILAIVAGLMITTVNGVSSFLTNDSQPNYQDPPIAVTREIQPANGFDQSLDSQDADPNDPFLPGPPENEPNSVEIRINIENTDGEQVSVDFQFVNETLVPADAEILGYHNFTSEISTSVRNITGVVLTTGTPDSIPMANDLGDEKKAEAYFMFEEPEADVSQEVIEPLRRQMRMELPEIPNLENGQLTYFAQDDQGFVYEIASESEERTFLRVNPQTKDSRLIDADDPLYPPDLTPLSQLSGIQDINVSTETNGEIGFHIQLSGENGRTAERSFPTMQFIDITYHEGIPFIFANDGNDVVLRLDQPETTPTLLFPENMLRSAEDGDFSHDEISFEDAANDRKSYSADIYAPNSEEFPDSVKILILKNGDNEELISFPIPAGMTVNQISLTYDDNTAMAHGIAVMDNGTYVLFEENNIHSRESYEAVTPQVLEVSKGDAPDVQVGQTAQTTIGSFTALYVNNAGTGPIQDIVISAAPLLGDYKVLSSDRYGYFSNTKDNSTRYNTFNFQLRRTDDQGIDVQLEIESGDEDLYDPDDVVREIGDRSTAKTEEQLQPEPTIEQLDNNQLDLGVAIATSNDGSMSFYREASSGTLYLQTYDQAAIQTSQEHFVPLTLNNGSSVSAELALSPDQVLQVEGKLYSPDPSDIEGNFTPNFLIIENEDGEVIETVTIPSNAIDEIYFGADNEDPSRLTATIIHDATRIVTLDRPADEPAVETSFNLRERLQNLSVNSTAVTELANGHHIATIRINDGSLLVVDIADQITDFEITNSSMMPEEIIDDVVLSYSKIGNTGEIKNITRRLQAIDGTWTETSRRVDTNDS